MFKEWMYICVFKEKDLTVNSDEGHTGANYAIFSPIFWKFEKNFGGKYWSLGNMGKRP